MCVNNLIEKPVHITITVPKKSTELYSNNRLPKCHVNTNGTRFEKRWSNELFNL